MQNKKEIVVSSKPQYELSNSQELHNLAIELKDYCTKLSLTINIQGKQYPLVEAWQFAGSRLGLLPIVKSVNNLSIENEIKYIAEVELINSQQQIIGRGIATCSNKEKNKKYFEEYAIISMAQTRAIGKAYRNTLAWIMKSAGYEPTPAEEMDFLRTENQNEIDKEAKEIINEMKKINGLFELQEFWNNNKSKISKMEEYQYILEAKDKLKTQFKEEGKL